MGFHSRAPILLMTVLILVATRAAGAELQLDRVSVRVTYVRDSEKLQRAHAVANAGNFEKEALPEGIIAEATDSLVAQVWCVDGEGNVAEPAMAMLRVSDESMSPPRDSMLPLTVRRSELRRDVSLAVEARTDPELWRSGVPLTLQVVVGDERLGSVVWTATRSFRLNVSATVGNPGNVFDFDVSARRTMQPEFAAALPVPEREASVPIVLAFTIFSVLPLIALLLLWARMGALRLHLPANTADCIALLLFQLCLTAHAGAFTMFWVRWNIVTTWKVVGALMAPTMYFGHRSLSAKATSDYLAEKAAIKKEN